MQTNKAHLKMQQANFILFFKIKYEMNKKCVKEALTRRQTLKVASLNMSGRQLLKASQALHDNKQ